LSDPTVDGACLCGAIRFRVTLPTLFCGHCHCTMCQRNHGAGFVTWVGVARDQIAILSGEADLQHYASSEHGQRSFCRACGTSLFCEIDAHPDQVDVPLASMQGPIDRAPQAHIYFDDRAEWVVVSDDLPRLGGTTGLEPSA